MAAAGGVSPRRHGCSKCTSFKRQEAQRPISARGRRACQVQCSQHYEHVPGKQSCPAHHSIGEAASRRHILMSIGSAAFMAQCFAGAPARAQSGPFCLTGPAQAAVADAFKASAEKSKGLILQIFTDPLGKPKGPVLLRLAFHDAATFSQSGGGDGGANASIRMELDRPENAGLKRGWRVIEAAAARLKGTPAEDLVSMADMIALGGAHAVKICGGPSISVPVGRKDAVTADPGGRLPAETLSATDLKAAFADKGLDTHDLVVLSGAHTLGGKGFGEPLTFDATYYKTLLKKPWADPTAEMGKMIGLPSDHVLPEDDDCLQLIQLFAANPDEFYKAFGPAYVKLTCLGATWT